MRTVCVPSCSPHLRPPAPAPRAGTLTTLSPTSFFSPLRHAQEWKRSRHPQLFYESKLYKIMAGAGEWSRARA